MPIVAVNGGGNTPQGVNDGDVDGGDFLVWQRGGSPLETGAFEIKDFSFGVENPTTIGGDTFDFQPELTSEPRLRKRHAMQVCHDYGDDRTDVGCNIF